MEETTLTVVTVSNVFGLLPITSYFMSGRYYGATLVSLAVISSVFMHISETKHKLPGLYFVEYSNTLLNIDRVFTLLVGPYGFYLFSKKIKIFTLVVAVIGFIASYTGEQTNNLRLYMICHVIWHFCGYLSLYLVC